MVRCASTMCRVAVAPRAGVAPQDVVTEVIHSRGAFSTGGHYNYDEVAGHVRFYVRRAGTPSFGPDDGRAEL